LKQTGGTVNPGAVLFAINVGIHLAGGVVQSHDQVIPEFILKPLMAAGVDMQQHPWQRTPLAGVPAPPARSLRGLLTLDKYIRSV